MMVVMKYIFVANNFKEVNQVNFRDLFYFVNFCFKIFNKQEHFIIKMTLNSSFSKKAYLSPQNLPEKRCILASLHNIC